MTETASPTGATTQGFAAQYGLIRPATGRQIAGVCAGIGRATDTDPLLWRVLFAVGVLFGGVGLVAYLLGWLLMPAEGDTGSPIEALFGRGHSSTSPPTAVLLAGAALILAVVTIQWTPLIILAVAIVGYLMYRQYVPHTPPAPPTPATPPPPAPPAGPGTPGETPPPGYSWPTTTVAPSVVPSEPATLGQPAAPAEPPTLDEPAAPEPPTSGEPGTAVERPEPGEFPASDARSESDERSEPDEGDEPGAGRGSVLAAESGRPAGMVHERVPTEAETVELPVPPEKADTEREGSELLELAERYRTGEDPTPVWEEPPAWQAQPPVPPGPSQPPQPPAKPPKPRSRLGRVALSAMLIVLGLVGASALLGASPGFSGYVAAALAIVGAALVVGTWFGRARGLIAVGALLSVVLAISSAAERVEVNPDGQQVWTPSSVAEIQHQYKIDLGDGTVDLTGVDFTGQDVPIELAVNAGHLRVIVPPDVDVVGKADISFGSADVLGHGYSAARGTDQKFSDLGEDHASGPGRITLDVKVNAGNLEVAR